MRRNIKTVATLIVGGVGIGVAISLSLIALLDSEPESSDSARAQENQYLKNGVSNETWPSVERSDFSRFSIPHNITDLTLSESTYERRVEFSSWILLLNESQLITWLEQSSNLDWAVSPKARKDVQTVLLQQLTQLNPTAALDFTLNNGDPLRMEFLQTVYYEWAMVDLDAAVKRASSFVPDLQIIALQGILYARDSLSLAERRTIAKELENESYAVTFHLRKLLETSIENPRETWYEVISLTEPNEEHDRILVEIAVAWISTSGLDVLDEILGSISDESVRTSVSLEILVEVARSLPDQAFAYAINLDSKNREPVVRSVIETWAKQEPLVALEAVKSVPPSLFRSGLEFSAVQQWVNHDPRDILSRLTEVPVSVREDAITEAIYLIAEDSPIEAASLVQQLEPELQWQARDVLMESWISQDLEAAIDWAKNSKTIEASTRPYLLHDLAAKVLWIDPKRAFQIARQVSLLAESTIGSEAMIVGRIAHSNIGLAVELLPQVRSGDTKTQAYVTVASEIITQGDLQTALDLGSQLPKSALDTFLVELAHRWALRDMTGLLAGMKSFPTADIRSKIALTLTQSKQHRKRFTEEQIEELQAFLNTNDRAILHSNPQ